VDNAAGVLSGLLTRYGEPLLTWGVALLLLLLAVWIMHPQLRRTLETWQIRRVIKRLGIASRCDVMLDDGMDGNAFIDYLVLTADRIVVLSVKRIQGVVFAAEGIETWANVVGNRSYKFPNPLPVVEAGVTAVKRLLPNVPVEGRLLFTCRASFPKGRPESVLLPGDVTRSKVKRFDQLPALLTDGWQQLSGELQSIPEQYRRELAVIGDEGCRKRVSWVVALLLLDAGWLIWRLMPSLVG